MANANPQAAEPSTAPRRRWPILRFLRRRLRGWRERHRLPFNFYIHMIGIPLAVSGVVLLFVLDWYWGVSAIVVGYLLQWIGHRAEGNDVGECDRRLPDYLHRTAHERVRKAAGVVSQRQETARRQHSCGRTAPDHFTHSLPLFLDSGRNGPSEDGNTLGRCGSMRGGL